MRFYLNVKFVVIKILKIYRELKIFKNTEIKQIRLSVSNGSTQTEEIRDEKRQRSITVNFLCHTIRLQSFSTLQKPLVRPIPRRRRVHSRDMFFTPRWTNVRRGRVLINRFPRKIQILCLLREKVRFRF